MGLFEKNAAAPTPINPQAAIAAVGGDPFGRIGNAEAREGGVYITPGVYSVLYVDALKMIRSRKGQDLFIAEFEILASSVTDRPTGTRVSWVVNFAHDPAPGNVKAFLSALMDVNPAEVDAEGAKFACSQDNPCHGRLIRCQAVETKTKAGLPFTSCTWTTISSEAQAKAEEMRKQAGFGVIPF